MGDDAAVRQGDSSSVTVLHCDDSETRDGRTEYKEWDVVSLVDAEEVERMLDSQPVTLELGLLTTPTSCTLRLGSGILVKGRDRRDFAGDLNGDTASSAS